MKVSLKPIKPKRISDQVFEQLRELIFRGEIKPGEKFMPERELAEVLSVSRTTVRDAIRKLVVMGFLEQKQGQGTFVRSPASIKKSPLAIAMDTQDATLIDLLEVRMGLETNAAALAAKRADENDIQFLEKSLRELDEEIKGGGLGIEVDVSFHMAITYAAKNPVQIYLMKNFFDFLFIGIKENLTHLYEKPSRIKLIASQHENIVTAIKNRDSAAAFEAMKTHIAYVMDFFERSGKE